MKEKRFAIDGMWYKITFYYQEDKSIRYEIQNELTMKTYITDDVKWEKQKS